MIHIGGLIAAGFLLAMLRGNHVGRVEDAFLISFAVLILVASRPRLVATPPRLDPLDSVQRAKRIRAEAV